MSKHDLTPRVVSDAPEGASLPSLRTPLGRCPVSVLLYPYGASLCHVHFQPGDQTAPLLYVSPDSHLDGSKPIRGGIPVCFPWFGVHPTDPDAAKHGTVRNENWDVIHAFADDAPGSQATGHDAPAFDALLRTHTDNFEASFRVQAFADDQAGGGTLRLTFTATNTTDQPQHFELALHTYFVVGDVAQVHVTGLHGHRYIDNLRDTQSPMRPLRQRHRYTEDRQQIRFDGECDRAYLSAPEGASGPITLHDPVLQRSIELTQTGCPSAVVWNPHIETSKNFTDLPNDAWPGFLCIESGLIADDAVMLEPGAEHTAAVTIRQSKA